MIYGLLCTKNEAGRYLDACLEWHKQFLDAIFVYDDQSDDDTVKLAQSHGAQVVVRPDDVPTFLEHEGKFRQASLEALEQRFPMKVGDWILVVDADEFLTGATDKIGDIAWQADLKGSKAVRLIRPEVWSADEVEGWFINPVARMDGWWGKITCTRLFRWEPGGKIRDKAMGCGNEPLYIHQTPIFDPVDTLYLVHLGYMQLEDRIDKFNRYSSMYNHGHNPEHIRSILESYDCTPWKGPWPDVWEGVRMTRGLG